MAFLNLDQFMGYVGVSDPARVMVTKVADECSKRFLRPLEVSHSECTNCGGSHWLNAERRVINSNGRFLDSYYENLGVEECVRVHVCGKCDCWMRVGDRYSSHEMRLYV